MKKTLLLLLSCLMSISMMAQTSDLKKAVARYRNASSVEATAVYTRHNAAVSKGKSSKGTLKMRQPGYVAISVDGGKNQLIMNGSTFTMVMRGKKHTTSSKTNAQFATFQQVLEYIVSGGKQGNLSSLKDLNISKSGNLVTLSITPAKTKKQRRQMFTGYVMTIDERTSELKSLVMKQKGKNYIQYNFSNFRFK